MSHSDDLHDDVDPKLQKLYHQLPKEQPSAELDAKILAAAKIVSQKKSPRWQAPFALAASVVLVSSVALYLHEENPAAFDASMPTTQAPATEMAQSSVKDINPAKPLPDRNSPSQNIKSEEVQAARADDINDNNFMVRAEEKAPLTSRADQIVAIVSVNESAKSIQPSVIAKEQEAKQAKIEMDQFATAARAQAAYAPAPVSPASPAPQIQPTPEVSEPRYLSEDRLQDSNRAGQELSTATTESDQNSVWEKSNRAPVKSTAPMAPAAMSLGVVAGSATLMRPTEHEKDKTRITDKIDATQNMNTPVLTIEGVAMGMSRAQLVAQGLTCYVNICHLDLGQPQQETYWGLPALNSRLTAVLSHHVVTKIMLQQKNVELNEVKIALSNIGVESQQSCKDEKGVLLIGRQLGKNIFNVRSMNMGLSLAVCQQKQ